MPGISVSKICVPFGGGGINWSSYWATQGSPWMQQGIVIDATEAHEQGMCQEPTVIYEGNPQILIGETNVFKTPHLIDAGLY